MSLTTDPAAWYAGVGIAGLLLILVLAVAAFADALHADRIDLVDLDRAGALLRHRVARDGVVLIERTPGTFDRFWLNAVDTWCDLAPILEPLDARALETLPG